MGSAHGTVVTFNAVPIDGARDITLPALMRKAVEDTRHIRGDDEYEAGIRRLGDLLFDLNVTAASMLSLLQAWENASLDVWSVEFPSGGAWRFSGFVVGIVTKAPVDGLYSATVTVHPSNGIDLNATIASALLQETGDTLLQEDGTALLLE